MKYSNWTRDLGAESVMEELGLSFIETDIDRNEVDEKLSAENRARKVALDQDRVESIRIAASKGQPLPKIVVRATQGKLVIAGGNHRFAATKTVKHLPAYVVECADSEFETLCRVLNTVVGQGPTTEERIQQACDAVKRFQITHAMAAKLYQLQPKQISKALINDQLEARITTLPASMRRKITRSHAAVLGELSKNTNILRSAAVAVTETKLAASSDEYRALCRAAKKASSEAEAILVFESAAKLGSNGHVLPRHKRKKFLSALTAITNEVGKSFAELEFDSKEIGEVKKQCAKAISYLNCLCKENG